MYSLFYLLFIIPPLWPHGLECGTALTHSHPVRDVGGPNRGRGTIVGGFCNPTRQLVRFSPPNVIYYKLFRISPRGEAINYRRYMPYTYPSFDEVKPCKITVISTIVICSK